MLSDDLLHPLFTIYLAFVLLVCTAVDIRHFIIPNLANAANLAGAAAFAMLSSQHVLASQMLGGLIGGGAFAALAMAFYRIRRREGLGFGDAKFMVGAGTWVGWQGVAPLVLAASVSALAYILIRRAVDPRFDPQGRIPFAPFLSAATLFMWLLQEYGGATWMA